MTSTFKLTRAEFKKIFKRPSIFIMAILLVVTIFASIGIFNPSARVDDTLMYENVSNPSQYYSTFNSDAIDSKSTFDAVVSATTSMIDFYGDYNTYLSELTKRYNNVMTTVNDLLNETRAEIKETYRQDLKGNLNDFKTYYATIGDIGSRYSSITDVTLSDWWQGGNYYLNDSLSDVTKLIEYTTDTSNTATDIANIYNTNGYGEKLKNTHQSGENFILTTLKGMSVRYNTYASEYVNNIRSGKSNLTQMIANKNAMYNILVKYQTYLKDILEYVNPLILITDDEYKTFTSKIDEAIEFLKPNATSDNSLEYHRDTQGLLEENGIMNYLIRFTENVYTSDKLTQVHLSDSLLSELNDITTKTSENGTQIVENMQSYLSDETLKNISFEGTKYKLLSTTYSTLIKDKIMFYITSDYDKSQYSKFYGYDFSSFNKYQAKEEISRCQYFIDNNVYSNSMLNNFSYSQNSGSKTNVWDFMYFTMELCTLIIIVFAMMLVCSLVTGETESGTIKLLLVRPYKRSKIITAKLLATIFFVVTFMLFSSVISFVGGYFLFGYTSMPVLSVLNGTIAFEISPLLLMLINILTLTLDVIFFVILALMISIICKNYAGSISACLVLVIINFAFNILFGGAFWYTLLPGMNTHLFKYFGNAFLTTGATGSLATVIQSLLITGIESSMTIWYSVFIMLAYSVVLLAVSYAVFQKRDF